ncbi:MAG: LamG-like jellyroll fold domain-containing protein [Rubripirellula sp.]
MDTPHDELERLLLEWESGTLDDDGLARVRELLKADPSARKRFVQLQMLSAALHQEHSAGLAHDATQPVASSVGWTTTEKKSLSHRPLWLAAIAATLVCVMAGRLAYVELANPTVVPTATTETADSSESKEQTSSGIALVTRMVDVAWAKDQERFDVDQSLMPGKLAFESGFVQIEFFCGATVIVEGPADLELESTMLARVNRGRLRAQVPPAARGFSIDIADMKVVDLGTEFGLSVTPDGTDVQVFDGEVELKRKSQEPKLLTAGQALVRVEGQKYKAASSSSKDFVDIATLASREQNQQEHRFQRWKARSNELRKDPRLIAYYAFDQQGGWDRRLESSLLPTDGELDGAIVGAHRLAGRWPSKHSLEFKRPGDRVRVQIPGEFGSLTLACWAKIDSLDRIFNSLFLTDGYNKGEPHWQILNTGQMYFSVRPSERATKGPTDQKVLSPRFWNPSLSGKWLHLATTYDASSGVASHYLNGEQLHRETIPVSKRVQTTRIGAASIGNWSSPTNPDAEFAIRNLNGSIDELAIFAAALDSDEIRGMYENGKP